MTLQPAALTPYQIPIQTRLARAIMRPTFRCIFYLLGRIHIYGKQNVPREGGYLIAINHVSLFDPPFAMAFWPTCPEAVGAIEIWSKPGQGSLARWYGGIPVHRGEYDRQLVEKMLAALESGHPLLIAPEGGRSHAPGLRRGLPGVAYAMDQARVPVVPVGITGTTDDFFEKGIHGKRPTVEMNIGKPLTLPPIQGSGESRRASRQHNVDIIMGEIASLLPEEYRGVYGKP